MFIKLTLKSSGADCWINLDKIIAIRNYDGPVDKNGSIVFTEDTSYWYVKEDVDIILKTIDHYSSKK